MAGKPATEGAGRPSHPESLASTNRAAHDLAGNLHGILEWFDAIRAIDRDARPDPVPAWWDGYVRDPEWNNPNQAAPNRPHRRTWARTKTIVLIDLLVTKWASFTEPIPITPTERPSFAACKESLRNLAGILHPGQPCARLRHEVIPEEWHLAQPLPVAWDEDPAGEAERAVGERIKRLAYELVRTPRGTKAQKRAELANAKAEHNRLRDERDARNTEGRAQAKREGRVSSAQLEQLQLSKKEWQVQIQRWRLGESDVRKLLFFLDGGLASLIRAFESFYATMDAATVPHAGGGRRVGGIAHAVALSEATDVLYQELGTILMDLVRIHGQRLTEHPVGLALVESGSPSGPCTPIPVNEARIATMGIGGNGADAVLMAALDSASKVAAFPASKWNAMQAACPGGNHQRWHAGELISAADLETLRSAERLLKLHQSRSAQNAPESATAVETPLRPNSATKAPAKIRESDKIHAEEVSRQYKVGEDLLNKQGVPKPAAEQVYKVLAGLRPDEVPGTLKPQAYWLRLLSHARGLGYLPATRSRRR